MTDLTHIDTWLFDLDNTLYPAETGFMKLIEVRMTDFVERTTGLPRDEARALQKKYWGELGTTLAGLIKHHGVDPEDFLDEVHDVSLDLLEPNPRLIAAIERLPGRRLIFTNGSEAHAIRVVEKLGLAHLMEDIFHIRSADYLPKPAPQTFTKMTADHAVDPRGAAFFEDSEKNLAPAADIGMTTVLVGQNAPASTAPFVHHKTDDLAGFLSQARLRETAA
ncbi:MAG: pyrimidine 5'-nucleotidase [Caulobacter sp.]|nr:pyrimidine 5'-nucleotidase [Caulobacter sp.]